MTHRVLVLAGPASTEPGAEVAQLLQAPPLAYECHRHLPIARLVAGNTVAIDDYRELPITVTSVAPLIATAVRRDHDDRSLADLRTPG